MKIALKVEYLDGTVEPVEAVFADFVGFERTWQRSVVRLETEMRLTDLAWLAWHSEKRMKRTTLQFVPDWINTVAEIEIRDEAGEDGLQSLDGHQIDGPDLLAGGRVLADQIEQRGEARHQDHRKRHHCEQRGRVRQRVAATLDDVQETVYGGTAGSRRGSVGHDRLVRKRQPHTLPKSGREFTPCRRRLSQDANGAANDRK